MQAKPVKKTWFIHDYETQNHVYFGSLASPHDPNNYIVATGWAIDGNPVQARYFLSDEEAKNDNWIDELEGCKWYVAHNATFEIHWMLRTYPKQFLNFLKNGGKVFCTQYAEYLLSHQLEMYPKLEDCAIKYGGSAKVDAVKLLWEQGVLTADIDKALLMRYLAGDGINEWSVKGDGFEGDVANTRRVCFSQVALLREQGMMAMFKERMDSLVFDAIATFFGLHVDMKVAERNLAKQQKEIAGIKESILSMMPDDIPPELEFSFTSDYHLSAFLFGGSVRYKKKVSYDPVKYVKVDAYEVTKADGTVEYIPLTAGINPSEPLTITRYKSGKNKGEPKVFRVDTEEELLKWGELQYHFDGLIDLASLPKIVSDAYLGKRAEFRAKNDLCDGSPLYSTGKDSLDVLAAHTPLAKPLKLLSALIKDTTTYYRSDDGKKGMLQFVEPTSIIHHQLNSCATVTGRKSSSNPNLQNLPRDGTSRVKEMLTSRFAHWVPISYKPSKIQYCYGLTHPERPVFYNLVDARGRIVEVDYSALEVVTLASISGDSNLMRMLVEGIDMHCYRLAAKLGEPYESVYEKCHNGAHPDHKQYKQWRTDIKPRAFSHQYGASAAGIAYSTGCTLQEAEEFKEIEFRLFPESNAYPAKFVRPEVERTGFEGKPHREQNPVTYQWTLYRRGYFTAKSGTRYSFRQQEQWKEGQKIMDYKDTQIANYWCQGEGSFIVQVACGRVIRELIKRDFFGGLVLPINTVHDAIYLDCATDALAKEAGTLVREIMESTPKYMTEVMPDLKDWNYHITPFPAAAEYGVSMMSKVDVD